VGQVTIYLEDEVEKKMIAAVKAARQSKSKWIAGLISEKVADEWPESVVELAGAWGDFPSLADLRAQSARDAIREKL
jgi:hypothetical protein